MTEIEFDGRHYLDDRMFLLHLARCTVEAPKDSMVATTVHHQSPPPTAVWCVVTYRNTSGYPPFRVDHFNTRQEAQAYLENVEPDTPRISLNGRAPRPRPSFAEFSAWKSAHDLLDYDYTSVFMPGGEDASEVVLQRA